MQTAWELVDRAAQRHPDATAIVDDRTVRHLTYRQLKSEVEAIAGGLARLGVNPGTLFATVLPSSFEHCIALLALTRLGAIPALISPRLQSKEVAELVESGPIQGAMVTGETDLADVLRTVLRPGAPLIKLASTTSDIDLFDTLRSRDCPPPPIVRSDATAFIFYTSGTTGLPKGVQVPWRAIESRTVFVSLQGGLTYGQHNRALILFPLYHVMGFFAGFLATLALGGRFYVSTSFNSATAIETIQKERITYLAATPTHYHALLYDPRFSNEALSSIELLVYAGAPMPGATHAALVRAARGRVVNMYGTTETMNSLFMREPEPGSQRLRPGFYANVRIAKIGHGVEDCARAEEDGELLVDATGPSVFTGYLNRPDATAAKVQGGWYRTGDLAAQLSDGTIELRGRIDDLIVSGAENIHPEEVERILLSHPAVMDASVVGIPDERWGERVVACVVAKHPGLTVPDLDQYCQATTLARFKRPKDYVFVDQLPRNAANKVLRRLVREEAERRLKSRKEIAS